MSVVETGRVERRLREPVRRGERAELLAGQRDPPHPWREVRHPDDLDLPQGQRAHGEPA